MNYSYMQINESKDNAEWKKQDKNSMSSFIQCFKKAKLEI